MAGLLDDDSEKSWVGQAFDGLLDNFLAPTEKRETQEEYDARMLRLFGNPKEGLYSVIDKSVEGLRTLGVPDDVLDGKPTTTEDNFYKSTERAIENLPSQVPKFLKAGVDVITDLPTASKGLMSLIDGGATNLGDVVYDTLLPKKYEKPFKDYRTSLMSEENIENEANVSALYNGLVDLASTPQGLREIFQQHGLDIGLLYSSLPKNLFGLSKANAAKLQNFADDNFPLPGGQTAGVFGSQMMGGEVAAIRLGKSAELDKAKQLASEGVDAQTIWKETGFALAQDGKFRFEIDDSKASLKDMSKQTMDTNTTVRGEDYLNHPELFAAYPELKDIDVKPFKYNLQPSQFGYYATTAGKPEIGINPVSQKTLEEYGQIKRGELDPKVLMLGKVAHEFQHGVQAIEDNAGGSSPRLEADRVILEENLPDIRSQITNIQLQMNALDTANKGSDLRPMLDLYNRKTDLEKELVTQEQYAIDKGDDNYRNRVLGELESFQTQADVALTAEERASRFPKYLQNENTLIRNNSTASGVEKGLLNEIAPQSLIKSTEFKRRNDGTYVGFSPALDTPQKLNKLITQLDKLAVEGKDARMWYEDSSNQILKLVQGDVVEAEKIAQIIAITSQGASVETNTGFAFKAYSQYKAGLPIEAGRFPAAQSKKIEAILNGGSWEGRKTNSFYRNLMVEIDPSKLAGTETTQDMWMARAFGLDSEVPGGAQYEIMERITQSIADKHDYKPHQAQAAIWVAVKARNDAMKSVINATVKEKGWGNNANDIFPQFQKKFDKYFQKTVYDGEYNVDEFLKASYSFADGIEDNLGYINLEAVPGTTTDLLPGIATASAEDVAAYTKDMYSIFLDKNGVDLLAKEVGIVSPGNFLGFGGWQGDINPNVQVRGILSGTQAGGINKADIELVETYASIVGTVFKQDGVSYRRAFADKTVGKQNAVDIDIGRTLTKDESVRLYDELTKQFGNDLISPTSSANGAEIINYTQFEDMPISNAEFKIMVKQAIIDADLGDVDIGYFRSEGNLLMNDWKENPNGEQYKNRENITSKSQAVYERMVNQYGKDAETINARYKKDYGW